MSSFRFLSLPRATVLTNRSCRISRQHGVAIMKTHLLRNIFIVGSTALALAASTVVLPSVADAAGAYVRPHAQSHGRIRRQFPRPQRTWWLWVWRHRLLWRLLSRLLRSYSVGPWSLRSVGLLRTAEPLLHNAGPLGFQVRPLGRGEIARRVWPSAGRGVSRPTCRRSDQRQAQSDGWLAPANSPLTFDAPEIRSDDAMSRL